MSERLGERSPAPGALREKRRLGRRPERWARGRRAAAPIRVAFLRIARRPARTAIVAGGVALATAMLVGVVSGSLIVRDRALGSALADVPAEQRAFRVDEFGLAFESSPAVRRRAAEALALLTSRPAVRTVVYRELRFQSHLVLLAGVKDAPRRLKLESGRTPGPCVPARCEVLVVGAQTLPRALTTPGLRVVPVGRASLSAPAVLGDFGQPEAATLLVTSDVRGLATAPALGSIFRTESWVVPIEPGAIRAWEVESLLAREARAQALLERADPAARLTAPDDALLEALRQGRVGTRRMLLVGGEVAALVLGFAVLAAMGLRRTLLAEWRRLEERGARRSQLWLFTLAETGVAALVGVLVGTALGAGAAALAGRQTGVGARSVLSHAVLTPWLLLLVVAVLALASLVLVFSVRTPSRAAAGPVRIGDVVALGALAVAAVAASRGGAGAEALAGNDTSVSLLLLFPGLVSLAAALLAARALGPLLRLAERAARRARPSIRLALLALARAPARTGVAVAFLVVSVGLALLAVAYRATLERGVRDEAAYQVPLDYTLTEGSRLVLPLEAASLARYRAVGRGVGAFPVLRRYADVASVGTARISPVVLGLDPRAVAGIYGWRPDFGKQRPTRLARLLGAGGPVRLTGAVLPPGTTGLALAADRRGADVELAVAIATPSQGIVRVPLLAAGSAGSGRAQRVPSRGRVVALEISLSRQAQAALAHREAEHAFGQGPEGSMELGPLVAFSRERRLGVVTSWRGWHGHMGATRVRNPGGSVRVRYALTAAQSAILRPTQPTDGHPLPVVVTPDVARSAPDGIVTLELGTQTVSGRIVAVANRFPGTADGAGSFVVTDESRLQTALDADVPGTGTPGELWLAAPPTARASVDAALRTPRFAPLVATSRHQVEQELRSDPLSRGIEITLGAGALLALALAVGGLWLTVLGEVADERGELYDLETQGATPGQLRAQLRLRAAILAALGVAGGLVLGIVLSALVVRLVQVSASGAAPVPPLVAQVSWHAVVAGLAAVVLVTAVLVELTVRRAFRESAARRVGEVA